MDSISLIIEAELKAQKIIDDARKKSDGIKIEVEIQGNKILEKTQQEVLQELEQYKEESETRFQTMATHYDREKTAYKYQLNVLMREKKDTILNQLVQIYIHDIN